MDERSTTIWSRTVGPLSFLWQLRAEVRQYRWHLFAISLLAVGVSGQALIMPQLTRRIIDVAYPARNLWLFFIISAIMVSLNMASTILQAIQGYFSTHVNNMVTFRIRMRVFRALNRVPVAYIEGHNSGMLLERASSDADTTANVLANLVPQLASLALTTGIAIVLMMKISMVVTSLVLVCVPAYSCFSIILATKMRRWEQEVRHKADQLTTLIAQTIEAVPTAKLFGARQWLQASYTRLLRDKIVIAFGMWRTQLVYGRLGWAVAYGWGVVLTCIGWYLVFQDRLLLGEAVALGMYIPLLLRPTEEAVKMYRSLMSASVSAQRINEVIGASQNGRAGLIYTNPQTLKSICLQGVSFMYPQASSQCLKDIALELRCGQTLVVLGPTGSGKTTLLRLLAGMYDWYEGDIVVNGHNLKHMKCDTYQTNVAMVTSENFFFSGSLIKNMQIAGPDVDEIHVRKAACVLGIDPWIQTLPCGYHTHLGVDGIRMSSGQSQKVALMRALLKRPKLLLLDEVTCGMDVESERHVLNALCQLRTTECITVITTHRLTITLEPWIDNIVVLADGRVTEQGRQRELYTSNGQYRRLMDLSGLGAMMKPHDCLPSRRSFSQSHQKT